MKPLSIVLLGIALAACSVAEPINPLGSGNGGGRAAGAGGAGHGGHGQGGGLVKRTVLTRNPFGNVAETQNLLWDGDFEFSNPFADEYGWVSGPPYDYSFSGIRVGPMCRSGIKCVAVSDKHVVIGIGVGMASAPLEASFYAHVSTAMATCDQIQASVTAGVFDTAPVDLDAAVKATSTKPDADGWCHFDTVVPARTQKASLFIENDTGGEIIVDDAVLKVAPPTDAGAPVHGAPTPKHVASIARARADLAKLRGPHEKPPSPARKAYEAWRRR